MEQVCIIAEAGVNHNGNLSIAKQMVNVAKEAGVDYIKFQTFIPGKLVAKFAGKAEYQKEATGTNETQLQMLQKLTLTYEEFIDIQKYCKKIDIGFISTPFDLESITFLESFNMDFWKIPSGEITNLPYLEKIAYTRRKVIMSTGMCDIKEILEAIGILENSGTSEIVLLHCNTQYPTPFNHANLSAMDTIRKITKKMVGYSDHTQGIEVPIAAVAMGATVIEKHFTLDKNMHGPDHKASLNPIELKAMVSAIRNIEVAKGNGLKKPSPSETINRDIARKSIVASTAIKKGTLLTENNLTTKRPGNGLSPMKWHNLLGKTASHDYCEDQLIDEEV